MLKDYLQIYTMSLVFVGDFNPTIIQPFWLSNKKLIRENEAETAKIEIIHNEIVRYEVNEWAFFEISKNRFQLRTSKEPEFEPLRDLAYSIFDILKETPIKALGINHLLHYSLKDKEIYHEFGNKLAPLSNWSDTLNEPKLLQLEIKEEKRKGSEGYLRVRISPSDKIPSSKFGVSININDHYSSSKTGNDLRGEMIKVLKENWTNSINKASEITENIWKKISS